ncbi:M23 family metallopeptidase [uncultured Agrococcus sp.]|uniref:M23 family metallopeptidase n=1 Tax=uncultured Agrococcus sp. TaxID=382258 RepID=UPI0025F47758|nr:M23 family metallopeptidase [uncultured Agrococcus sp.]
MRVITAIDLEYPFSGRWLTQNSPAVRVPSHGTALFGTSYAIDFVPVDDRGRTAPFTLASLVRPERPEKFPGFGRPVLSPVAGRVVAVHDAEQDHGAFRGFPSVAYALTQRRRVAAGWIGLAGNHVMIEADGAVVALCHLQHGSVSVRAGQALQIGDVVGRCGNSGNCTEPHLHLQAMDHRDPRRARAVPITFRGGLPRNGEIIEAAPGD